MVKRVYVDTSVIGGYYDEEFSEDTAPVVEQVKNEKLILIISDLLEAELTGAPPSVRELLSQLPITQLERVQLDATTTALADTYISEKVVGKTSRADFQHIALATIHRADVLISWNFKHIVNLERIRGYNAVNIKHGHVQLDIRSPKEIITDED